MGKQWRRRSVSLSLSTKYELFNRLARGHSTPRIAVQSLLGWVRCHGVPLLHIGSRKGMVENTVDELLTFFLLLNEFLANAIILLEIVPLLVHSFILAWKLLVNSFFDVECLLVDNFMVLYLYHFWSLELEGLPYLVAAIKTGWRFFKCVQIVVFFLLFRYLLQIGVVSLARFHYQRVEVVAKLWSFGLSRWLLLLSVF